MDPGYLDFSHIKHNEISPIHTSEDAKNFLMEKIEFIILIFSNTCYMFFVIKSITRMISTRDWKFSFLLVAALFAFMNNTSDTIFRIMAPIKFGYNCNKNFKYFFIASATLNWVPISYYQIVRLYSLTYNYYKKAYHRIIIVGSVLLSIIYSLCYFCNLSGFHGSKTRFGGCVVYNTKEYGQWVEVADIADTFYSLLFVILTYESTIRNIKQYKSRHLKIKNMVDENIILFGILEVSKILLYYVINKKKGEPGGDIWWDTLSIIVMACCYRLLNAKPRLNELDKHGNKIRNINKRNKNYLKDLSQLANENKNKINKPEKINIKKLYTKNSKGELNFPSLVKKNNGNNINNPYLINNRLSNQNIQNFNYQNYLNYNNNYDDIFESRSTLSNNNKNIGININNLNNPYNYSGTSSMHSMRSLQPYFRKNY
ncbi:hypothetical protein BCR32DRAFT_291158 [Anaeromyces robustus]|uniref:Uncharacterized protein n=1 Tax=Anaeromyces robustus TaxID=1754192 RepID=A0A1Y1XG18_9FUNG|nr:hypothetical protein BCR32DRAFT_291158 [Anaeromyces robustus]|eukprot:ORX84700.1 hypothetical protein BCR32DRAFT_291158 [Anaeromyces robustus]